MTVTIIFNRSYRGPCQVRSHFPKQQMIGRILTTSLQLGGCLWTSEILVTVSTGYYQQFSTIDVVLLCFVRFQRISVHLWTRVWFWRGYRFHASEETHVSGMSMRNTWKKRDKISDLEIRIQKTSASSIGNRQNIYTTQFPNLCPSILFKWILTSCTWHNSCE